MYKYIHIYIPTILTAKRLPELMGSPSDVVMSSTRTIRNTSPTHSLGKLRRGSTLSYTYHRIACWNWFLLWCNFSDLRCQWADQRRNWIIMHVLVHVTTYGIPYGAQQLAIAGSHQWVFADGLQTCSRSESMYCTIHTWCGIFRGSCDRDFLLHTTNYTWVHKIPPPITNRPGYLLDVSVPWTTSAASKSWKLFYIRTIVRMIICEVSILPLNLHRMQGPCGKSQKKKPKKSQKKTKKNYNKVKPLILSLFWLCLTRPDSVLSLSAMRTSNPKNRNFGTTPCIQYPQFWLGQFWRSFAWSSLKLYSPWRNLRHQSRNYFFTYHMYDAML